LFKNTFVAVSMLALGLAGSAHAAIIGNGPPNQTGGSDLNAFLEADNFTLAGSNTITQIKYWTLQNTLADYAGTTDWGFYTDASGVPGTALFSGNTMATGVATGAMTQGLNEFAYTFAVNIVLGPGNYWLVLHNGPSNNIPNTMYYWAWSSDTGNSQSMDVMQMVAAPVPGPNPPTWSGNFTELAFELTATPTVVPEPASMALVGGGLFAAWFVRRKIAVKG
jgi:PEP-CTERM motif-containing protein